MTDIIQNPSALLGFKALVLLVIAFGLTRAMKLANASASKRSLVWTCCFTGLLLLPVGSLSTPTWHLGFFSQATLSSTPPEQIEKLFEESIGKQPTFSSLSSSQSPLESVPELIPRLRPSNTPAVVAIANPDRVRDQAPHQATNTRWLLSIWGLGFLLVVSRTVLGWFSLQRLKHQARECHDEAWLEALHDIKADMGIRRPIRILMSHHRDIPMTWGIFRPIVHLPLAARKWSPGKRQIVLIHELAHIRRFDSTLQLFGQIASAFYWYNPLVWSGLSRLRAEQEAACDDTVLRQGQTATLYADNLTSIICGRSSSVWESTVTLAAGRPGKLETRIEHILSQSPCRKQASRGTVATMIGTTLIATILVGSVSPFTPPVFAANHATRPGETESPKDLESLRQTLIEHSFKNVDGQLMTQSAIEAMIQSLDDPHAKYLSAAEVAEMQVLVDVELLGIGAQLERADDSFKIVRPFPGSPALEAGLRSGDIIEAVDGATTQGLDLSELVKRIRGPLGSTVRLDISRNDEQQTITVTRDRIRLSSVYGLRGVRASDQQDSPHEIGHGRDIGYFQISYFGKHTASEVETLLSQFSEQNIKGAIMDLRYCPGGSLEAATQVVDHFIDSGDIVTIKNREGQATRIEARDEQHWHLPLVILVNEATASAGEIVSGALQDHERAIVLGTRSFGKGSVQTLLRISGRLGAIRLTTAKYALPHGREIDRLPGASSWGIEANEGYFVPLQAPERELKDRLQGVFRSESQAIQMRDFSPEACRQTLGDTQLAAALETLESKLSSGTYKPVGGSRGALHDYIVQREHEKQQAALLEKLDDIHSAVGELIQSNP